jgi:hypothetical protein
MKSLTTVLLGAATAVLAGCVVTSVYPFYTEKDLFFEPALVGDWIKQTKDSDREVWKFEKSGDLAYRFTLIETSRATVTEAHIFKLQGQLFLDVASIEQDYHVIPPHYLLKVSQVTPTLRMSELSDDWLKALVTKKPSAILHHFVKTGDHSDDLRVVLTADTPELQTFVLKNLKTPGAWKDELELKR